MTQPEHPETFSVDVEQQDRGWMVVVTADGERKEIEPPYPDRDKAQFAADAISKGTDRWTGAASAEAPDPEKYPGDGEQ